MRRLLALLVLLVASTVPWHLLTAAPPALAAGTLTHPAAPAIIRYRWPLDGHPTVTRAFEPPPHPWLPGHRGVDLGSRPGATVRAAGPGVVAFAGVIAGTGVVSIVHPGGLHTTYQPVTPLVRAGQMIVAGDPIGALLAGHDGCPVAACLHWGLRRGEEYLDPLSLLRTARVRLLPTQERRQR